MSYPTIQACLAANPTMTVLVNPDGTYSPIDPPAVAETIPDVTSWQLTKALIETGMIAAVESLVAAPTTDPLIKYGWSKATTYNRHDPVVLAAQAGMSLTDAQVDGLFALAASK